MGFERLKFTKNWNSATDFPTLETSETQVRADMQLLHDESKNALNALMEALEQGGSDVLVRFGSEEVRYIRMNDSGGLEVSSDGVNYAIVATGTAGGAAPSIHASQHASGGTDPITPAAIGAQPTVSGAATTITSKNLTANRALVSNSSGKVAVSAVTATELGYLDGVTSGIQNQLNNKAALSHASRHASGGDDQITPADIGAADDDHDHAWSAITGKPDTFTPAEHSHTAEDVGALPISGGTLTGNLTINKSNPLLTFKHTDGFGGALQSFSNLMAFLAYDDASKNTGANHRRLALYNVAGASDVVDALVLREVVSGSSNSYRIFHEGNKPTGSYTGNGDATARTIETGGAGKLVMITSSNGLVMLTNSSGFLVQGGSSVMSAIAYSEGHVEDGVITIASTNSTLNASNVTYYYQLL